MTKVDPPVRPWDDPVRLTSYGTDGIHLLSLSPIHRYAVIYPVGVYTSGTPILSFQGEHLVLVLKP